MYSIFKRMSYLEYSPHVFTKNEFKIFMNFFKQSHWHDKTKSKKQKKQINEHDLFWLIKKFLKIRHLFFVKHSLIITYVFSGGDNKIGVAVRKPDGSVALPYKWQVIQKKGYLSCSSDANNQFWIYKFRIALFNFFKSWKLKREEGAW